MVKIELNDDELEKVNAGVDFGTIDDKDINSFVKSLNIGDIKAIHYMLNRLVVSGAEKTDIRKMINHYTNNLEIKKIIEGLL